MHHFRDEMIEKGVVIQGSGRHTEFCFQNDGCWARNRTDIGSWKMSDSDSEMPLETPKHGLKRFWYASGIILMTIGNLFLVNDIFPYMTGTLKTVRL
jgi:hypothetical protein